MINGVFEKVNLESAQAQDTKRQAGTETATAASVAKEKIVNSEETKKQKTYDVQEAMHRVSTTAKMFNRKIHLEIDKDLNMVIVKVIDKETDEVIRQIPPEELVELAKHANDIKGLLINTEG
jgi:flagellar protein FlaG